MMFYAAERALQHGALILILNEKLPEKHTSALLRPLMLPRGKMGG